MSDDDQHEPLIVGAHSRSDNNGPHNRHQQHQHDYQHDEVPSLQQQPDGKFPRCRHILGLMGFLGFANVYAMRVNLSVAVVAMVNHTAIPSITNASDITDVCPMPPDSNSTIPSVSVPNV